jgi:Kef-type K+ transport system membrane component KefB
MFSHPQRNGKYANREALGIGTLMDSVGLMELIIKNIGLQRGIISERLFAVLVIMAVVTPLMASPIIDRLVGPGRDDSKSDPKSDELRTNCSIPLNDLGGGPVKTLT